LPSTFDRSRHRRHHARHPVREDVGLVSAVVLVVLSKLVWVSVLGNAQPIFPYDQPALFSMPLAFLVTILVSKLDTSRAAEGEKQAFEDQYVRAQTGYGAATASAH
jgi:cation/acetate symporter